MLVLSQGNEFIKLETSRLLRKFLWALLWLV